MGWQEPDGLQQGEVQGPTAGEEQPQAPPENVGEHLGRKGPGGAGGLQVEHWSAMCPCLKEGHWYLGCVSCWLG